MKNKVVSMESEPPVQERHDESGNRDGSPHGGLRRWARRVVARQLTLISVVSLRVVCWLGRKRGLVSGGGYRILLTGRFDSNNWILNHLGPLSASQRCNRVWMVSTNPVPPLQKVEAIYPSRWLIRAMGKTPARLLTFLYVAIRKQPHIVGGFHIMVNGITSVIVARMIGARSMYFCVGGPAEIRDGGIHSDDSLLRDTGVPDPVVERRLLRVAAHSDTIITMGSKAVDFFCEKGIGVDCHVVSGGIDSRRFQPAKEPASYDLITTGRLVQIKRIDVFLQAVKKVADRMPHVKAVIVGDGKLRDRLQSLSVDLGLSGNVFFAGHQDRVENWLCKSKIFVLTSDSEGLSLSMMEAMMCGLPAVVSEVGDLGDLVESGVNGFLVPRRSPALFADRLVELLSDAQELKAFSWAARRSAMRYETQATVRRWDHILHLNGNGES